MSDVEQVRRQAEEDHRRNQQAQMASEQQIRDAVLRNEYNARLAREREEEERRRQHKQG